ncbi:MAG: FAD-binding oxidoreductase [Candidatus Saccharimonadales bacterium]
MSNLADHLRKHLRGEVLDAKPAIDYFSTDSSIFKVQPRAIIYPRNVTDLRKIAKFSSQLAERGKKLPITARGKGTDQSGGAIGDGLMVVLPAHMNKLIDLDRESVTVQPGMLYGDLQRTLFSHRRYLPPYPSSIEYSTLGGAVANNARGEKSLKYGSTADYIQELEVVLSNGDVIRTRPLSKRELSRKMGQSDFEGEIYRKIDGLLADNAEQIEAARINVSKNSAGYALWDVRQPDGGVDLSRLIAGSQGTLGMVSEITFRTEAYNPDTHLMAIFFDEVVQAGQAVELLTQLAPSAMEVVDHYLLDFLRRHQPDQLSGIVEGELPKLVFLVEFDDEKATTRKRKVKKAQKLLQDIAREIKVCTDYEDQEDLWKIRRSAAALIWQDKGKKKALPIIEDGVVPADKLTEFLEKSYQLFGRYKLEIAVWGHAGNGNLHMQPFLDLDNSGDRQTVIKLMDEFYAMVAEMGGSTSGEHNDGRLRAPYLKELYGDEIYALFNEVKQLFDPQGILNPGVKLGVTRDMLRKQMRREYDVKHLYDHMPHAHQ